MNDAMTQRALALVEQCVDPQKLRQIAANAAKQGNDAVERAARLKLYAVLPSEEPGTLEFDVWQSIHCLEDALKIERGKTIRLNRTRQKISRDGEYKTVADLVLGKQSEGFDMLIDRDMSELTFEAVAIKHKSLFSNDVIEAARTRLSKAGVDGHD